MIRRGLINVYLHYREPLAEFTRRLLHSSMRRSSLGWGWLLLQPMLMLAAYLITFTFVFPTNYGVNATDTRLDNAVAVYLSLTVFGFATDIIGGMPFLLEGHRSLLQNTRLPAEVFIVAYLQGAIIRFAISLALCIAIAATLSHVHLTMLFAVPILVAYTFFLLGLGIILGVLGAIYPDLRQLVGLISTILMFCSAVFYPGRMLPLWLARLNPVFQAVDLTRRYVLWGDPFAAGIEGLVVEILFAILAIGLGTVLLNRLRPLLTE